MTDSTLDLLMDLLRLPGLSGREGPVAARLRESWSPLADELHFDSLGNLIAIRFGVGPAPRPRILITAHMDSVGFIVRGIVDGFLQLTRVGRSDPRLLPGQMVRVHAERPLLGMIVAPPRWCLPDDIGAGVVPLEYLLVDPGLSPREIRRAVQVGDGVSFDDSPEILAQDLLCGHSLDNRASLAALTRCLELLVGTTFAWDLVLTATVQEETTLLGAHTTAKAVAPTAAIVVDVNYGRAYSGPENEMFPLGGGLTNSWSPEVHPAMYAEIEAAAQRANIALAREVLPTRTGTEASSLLLAGEGIPVGLLSIPLRYMHHPTEVVHMADVRQAGELLAELVTGLADDLSQRLAQE